VIRARKIAALAFATLATGLWRPARAQNADTAVARRAAECPSCAEWNVSQKPFHVFGNVWYVGTHGLSSILITSPGGHILLDGALPESAPLIAANVASLGFRIADVKLILNSHVHFDHAGGLAALQAASGAKVAATVSSAKALRAGHSFDDDPQFGAILPYAPVRNVQVVRNGETLHVGPLGITAHVTAGHTPGGTTWTWRTCENARCLDLVYADSQTPVSADDFFYTRSTTYPNAVSDFEQGLAVLESLHCDVLLTPHPDASSFWERIAKRDAGDADGFVQPDACQRYAAAGRQRLATRLAKERR
jgi:metallo-beta-lactamase class B